MEAGLAIIRNTPETRSVEIENHQVTVELAADPEQTAALLERLTAAGARLYSFAEKEPTLEDVFMHITEEGGRRKVEGTED